jgi:hypoxanthine phosphoribosyltransferase
MQIHTHIHTHTRTHRHCSTLLNKSSRRAPNLDLTLDYCGFDCPDEFVVGYGMDYDERYRCLPYVAVLRPEVYTKSSNK